MRAVTSFILPVRALRILLCRSRPKTRPLCTATYHISHFTASANTAAAIIDCPALGMLHSRRPVASRASSFPQMHQGCSLMKEMARDLRSVRTGVVSKNSRSCGANDRRETSLAQIGFTFPSSTTPALRGWSAVQRKFARRPVVPGPRLSQGRGRAEAMPAPTCRAHKLFPPPC